MAIDHGKQGIRVNRPCPGDVEIPMPATDAAARRMTYADYKRAPPIFHSAGSEAALFLASDDSSFMTGAALVVDGGGIAG